MIDIDIDWTTEDDRGRRRPKASTIHGWLRMWRGTFAGNERVRQQGRHEMKVARALREYDSKKSGGNGGPFSLLRGLSNRRNAQVATARPTPQRHKSSSSRHHRGGNKSHPAPRPMPTKRKSSSSGANKGHHPSRHGHSHASTRPEATHHHRSHSANSRTRPSRQASGRR